MHPDVIRNEHGPCPKCGMSLIAQGPEGKKVNAEGHDKHSGHSVEMFRSRFWLSFVLTIPVLLYSASIQNWLNFTPPSFGGSEYIPFIFSTIIFFYGGLVFLKSARGELKARRPGMMTLISLAITTAFVYSLAVQFGLSG